MDESNTDRVQGTVKWFDPKKGFGFIAGDDGQDLFVHHTAIQMEGFKTLSDGQRITCMVTEGEGTKGPMAVDVQLG